MWIPKNLCRKSINALKSFAIVVLFILLFPIRAIVIELFECWIWKSSAFGEAANGVSKKWCIFSKLKWYEFVSLFWKIWNSSEKRLLLQGYLRGFACKNPPKKVSYPCQPV